MKNKILKTFFITKKLNHINYEYNFRDSFLLSNPRIALQQMRYGLILTIMLMVIAVSGITPGAEFSIIAGAGVSQPPVGGKSIDMLNDMNISQAILQTFQGRTDCYGCELNSNDQTTGSCCKESLNEQVMQEHLLGNKRIGIYPLSPEILSGTGVHFAAIDIDIDDYDFAERCFDIAKDFKFHGYLEKSKSKGYHIWFFFSDVVDAAKVRKVLDSIVDTVKAENNINFGIEIFTKQDKLSSYQNYGNYVYLPLFGSDIESGSTVFLNVENNGLPYDDQWELIESIKKISPDEFGNVFASLENQVETVSLAKSSQSLQVKTPMKEVLPCIQNIINSGLQEGCRNEAGFALVIFYAGKGLNLDERIKLLSTWNAKNNPPLDASELQIIATQGEKYSSYPCQQLFSLGICNKDLKENCPIKKNTSLIKHNPQKSTVYGQSPHFDGKTFIPKRLADEIMAGGNFIIPQLRIIIGKPSV